MELRFLFLLIAMRIIAGQEPVSLAPAIEGIVFDEDTKNPISGARVRAFETDYDFNGVRRVSFVSNSADFTDKDGRYALSGLPPGEYFLRVENDTFTPTFYPNTTDWKAAAPLVYTGTGRLSVDVGVGRRGLHRITGKITNTSNEPEKGYTVLFIRLVAIDGIRHEPLGMMNRSKDKERSFEIEDIPSGAYDLSATTRVPNFPGKKGNSGRTRIDLRSEDLTDVEIVIKAGVNLKGRITVPQDSPPIDLTKLQVWIRDRDNPFTRPNDPEPAPVAADGSFTIENVTDEEHQLMEILGLPEYACIQRATLDGVDVLHSWMTVQSNSSFLDITVDGRGGEVSGRLTDGRDRLYNDSATVVLVPIRQLGELNRASAKAVAIESGGRFRITGIRSGEYRLLAWHKLKGAAYLNAEFIADYERRGNLVKVERDSRLTADAPVVDAR
ncbi:MAG TPA: carboxypeptidase regulatory-like domain-containing protein [Terriglobia bacterium]|nr:carboxypeptidase regulatory-like domain-containing protein [Terriglobia bacterium]